METNIRQVSAKGWVVIPQDLREKYGLTTGMSVRFIDYGGVLAIVPASQDPIAAGYGLLRGRNLIGRLLEDHARQGAGDGRG